MEDINMINYRYLRDIFLNISDIKIKIKYEIYSEKINIRVSSEKEYLVEISKINMLKNTPPKVYLKLVYKNYSKDFEKVIIPNLKIPSFIYWTLNKDSIYIGDTFFNTKKIKIKDNGNLEIYDKKLPNLDNYYLMYLKGYEILYKEIYKKDISEYLKLYYKDSAIEKEEYTKIIPYLCANIYYFKKQEKEE